MLVSCWVLGFFLPSGQVTASLRHCSRPSPARAWQLTHADRYTRWPARWLGVNPSPCRSTATSARTNGAAGDAAGSPVQPFTGLW